MIIDPEELGEWIARALIALAIVHFIINLILNNV